MTSNCSFAIGSGFFARLREAVSSSGIQLSANNAFVPSRGKDFGMRKRAEAYRRGDGWRQIATERNGSRQFQAGATRRDSSRQIATEGSTREGRRQPKTR